MTIPCSVKDLELKKFVESPPDSSDTATNKFRLSCAFLWGHDSAANDIRARISIDGSPFEEMRVEPKDQGGDQRIPSTLTSYTSNLSIGSHTLELEYRPGTSSRTSSMYQSTLEVWRVS